MTVSICLNPGMTQILCHENNFFLLLTSFRIANSVIWQ